MLRALNPNQTPCSYPVPWRVDRGDPQHPVVTNGSNESAETVRAFVMSQGDDTFTEMFGRVEPGESIQLCLCSTDPHATIVSFAWFHPTTGGEYLWRFVP